jgi:hypothetical protein
MEKPLTARQQACVSHVLAGCSPTEAARRAGYGPAYSKVAVSRVSAISSVKEALRAGHQTLREQSMFDAHAAIKQIDEQTKGALSGKNPNHMAAAKLLEIKCRICGLMIEELHLKVEPMNLRSALEEARRRVFVLNAPRLSLIDDPFDDSGNG